MPIVSRAPRREGVGSSSGQWHLWEGEATVSLERRGLDTGRGRRPSTVSVQYSDGAQPRRPCGGRKDGQRCAPVESVGAWGAGPVASTGPHVANAIWCELVILHVT